MSNLDYTKTGFCTAAVHAGYIRDKEWGAEATPIYQTSTYTFETLEEGGGVFSGTVPKYPYARTANPTVATFERKMCALEHANAAVATGSPRCWAFCRPATTSSAPIPFTAAPTSS